MGVDLVLMPVLDKDCKAAHDMLNCERRSELFDEIRALDSSAVKGGIMCYRYSDRDYTGYGYAVVDDYEKHLRFVTVGELLKLSSHEGVRGSFRMRAIWAFLAQYPADWPVVLFWTRGRK